MIVNAHADCIEANTEEDGLIKVVVSCNVVASVYARVSRFYKCYYWLLSVDEDHAFAPVGLGLCEQMVILQSFFFDIENVDDYTYKHVQYEKRSHDHKSHKIECPVSAVIFNRFLIYATCIHCIPHNAYPPFCSHHIE